MDHVLGLFEQHRGHLFGIAYRMVGSATEAEDLVQEVWLRWSSRVDLEVEHPRAFLAATITHLSIDHLRKVKQQRLSYTGPWLPEPLVGPAPSPEDPTLMAQSLSAAFLLLLERLDPVERAVFLLREVFDYDYAEVATFTGKSEAHCRQILKRARDHIHAGRPRPGASPERRQELLLAFVQAVSGGDLAGIQRLLSDDIEFHSDGGGVTNAALRVVTTPDKVGRMLLGLAKKMNPAWTLEMAWMGGEPGLLFKLDGQVVQALSISADPNHITAIYSVLNPHKLSHLNAAPS